VTRGVLAGPLPRASEFRSARHRARRLGSEPPVFSPCPRRDLRPLAPGGPNVVRIRIRRLSRHDHPRPMLLAIPLSRCSGPAPGLQRPSGTIWKGSRGPASRHEPKALGRQVMHRKFRPADRLLPTAAARLHPRIAPDCSGRIASLNLGGRGWPRTKLATLGARADPRGVGRVPRSLCPPDGSAFGRSKRAAPLSGWSAASSPSVWPTGSERRGGPCRSSHGPNSGARNAQKRTSRVERRAHPE
jgi:hypothetical protein